MQSKLFGEFGMGIQITPNDLFLQHDIEDVNLDLAIILGGPDRELRERIETGVELYKSGKVPKLLLTGRGRGERVDVTEAAKMFDFATERGVPADALFVEDDSKDTIANANNCSAIIKNNAAFSRVVNIAILSSPFHMLRAYVIFRRHLGSEFNIYAQPSSRGFTAENWELDPWTASQIAKEPTRIQRLARSGYKVDDLI